MVQIDPMEYEKRHLFLGNVSFILALIGLILFIVAMIITFVFPYIILLFIYPASILTSLGLLFGAITYFGPYKVKMGLAGFIIALVTTCIIPALTVLVSYGMYFYTSGLMHY